MNSPVQPPVDDALSADPVAETSEHPAEAEGGAAIPAFKFPFNPSAFAQAKNAQQPWYKNGATNGHTKTPGAAPPGTRRSMGKR
ncbi:hypothetical protein BK634_30635 [Pseudomonas chlororaphis]|jgi:hypothetical protein|uniref:Uncharacterized protein n=1 Tax=Pseudomonas morbosilactucae TaxID=2938197 RepID=A0A9X1YTM4_9PSED|nr:hypothetical protein [Pseudomonas morbosilactucae]MCK9797734.1 hypothetical protein [Pseudomonas morbosilactucae]MCK9813361.1 hypothetical protein [Pseudomonas morbosilactucae]ROL63198.1 hypothetical protein BK634_30635 [Pseudomonas chlororaphis]WEK09079.1 MAG: hypothetical protein P0Y51_29265 [Pseudomonas sp.]